MNLAQESGGDPEFSVMLPADLSGKSGPRGRSFRLADRLVAHGVFLTLGVLWCVVSRYRFAIPDGYSTNMLRTNTRVDTEIRAEEFFVPRVCWAALDALGTLSGVGRQFAAVVRGARRWWPWR
jgi:hypothetical protein